MVSLWLSTTFISAVQPETVICLVYRRFPLQAGAASNMKKSKKNSPLGLGTRAIHAGQHPDPSTGAIMTPIYATSTYVQQSPGKHKGYEYSRTQNPTRIAYERCVADLEGGAAAFAFGSGM